MVSTEYDGPRRVWTTLITNTNYMSGLLTLEFSLRKSGSNYPLVALCTDAVPEEGLKALKARNIIHRRIPYLLPSVPKEYENDPRFYDCWSKLAPFSLTEYERVVQMDSDMLVRKNMDELMEMELDPPERNGDGERVYAASHACACNPLRKPHYPKNWIPQNCAFTAQHAKPDEAQHTGPGPTAGIASPNGGLVVVNPSQGIYEKILQTLKDGNSTGGYDFADQSLLGDLFYGRWVGLPYIYNALKTMRWEGVHHQIWRDDQVKNVHYILSPKPWDERPGETRDEAHRWWQKTNDERLAEEKAQGVEDGF